MYKHAAYFNVHAFWSRDKRFDPNPYPIAHVLEDSHQQMSARSWRICDDGDEAPKSAEAQRIRKSSTSEHPIMFTMIEEKNGPLLP
jgi:hypothetical protein